MESIKITLNNKEIALPIIKGSEGELALDITSLRKETGFITLDPGYANTGACISNITFIDGEKGILGNAGAGGGVGADGAVGAAGDAGDKGSKGNQGNEGDSPAGDAGENGTGILTGYVVGSLVE